MICPDHYDPRDPVTGDPVEDSWMDRDGYQVCSFCGSMNPDLFLKLLEEGASLGTTTKDYKVYIHFPNPISGQEIVMSRSSGPARVYGVLQREDLTPEEISSNRWERVTRGPAPERATGKFYWRHLTTGQHQRFVDLLNSGKPKFEGGFGFSPLPFFVGLKGYYNGTEGSADLPYVYCLRGDELK